MPTPANATLWCIQGQPFNFCDVIRSSSTLNPITGGLTSLAVSISQNDGSFTSLPSGQFSELPASSGLVSIDLTAANTNCNKLVYQITASNANAIYAMGEVKILNLAAFTGRADVQSPLRFEQYLLDALILVGWGGASQSGAEETYTNPNGSTHFACSISQNIAGPSQTASRTLPQ